MNPLEDLFVDEEDDRETSRVRRVERALRESEQRNRAIVSSALDAIITIDHCGAITRFNPAAEQLFGYRQADVLGRDLADTIIPPGMRQAHRLGLIRHRDAQVAPRLGVRLMLTALHADGHEFPVELTVTRLVGTGLPQFTAFIRDLTAQQQAEAEAQRLAVQLRESESQYRSLFVHSPKPMAVYDPESLRMLAMNEAGLALYGYTEKEVLQMRLEQFRPEEDAELWLRTALAGPLVGRREFSSRHIKKNGQIIHVKTTSSDIMFHGRRARVVLVDDVTEQHSAALALRKSEARFRALTELSADWFWEQDEHLCFVNINDGISYPITIPPAHEVIGKARWEIDSVNMEGGWEEHRQQLLRREPFRDVEMTHLGADGSLRIVSLSGMPVFDDTGRFTGYRGVGRDITESRRAQQEVARLNEELEERVRQRTAQLEAVNRELEAFSYSIAHDLRSPLTSIDGFSHVLTESHGAQLDETGRHYLRRIRAGVQQMADLTDGMLTLAHLSRVSLRYERFDLARAARNTLLQLCECEPQREVVTELPEHLWVKGDPRLLHQVIANLVGNAWKFSGNKPQVHITLGQRDGHDGQPEYFVADQGAGFDMAFASRLFGAFQRLHATSEFEGTGIGLALVQKIINRHGGRIRAQAQPGEGATFFFTLADAPPQLAEN